MSDKNEFILVSKEIYAALTGCTPTDIEERIIALKVSKIFAMLKSDLSSDIIEGYKELICYTAALMTALDISEKEKALFSRPVRIGDITMKSAVGGEGLAIMIKAQLRELAPILQDGNFVFKVMEES